MELSAGIPPTSAVGEGGAQGATVTGTQGTGVSTPCAAEVAEATVGFESVVHMPKGGMFAIGLKSMMFAAGTPPTRVRLAGGTMSAEGATPNEHMSCAPITTCLGIDEGSANGVGGAPYGARAPGPSRARRPAASPDRLPSARRGGVSLRAAARAQPSGRRSVEARIE